MMASNTSQQSGEVSSLPVCPEECRASGEGVKVAMIGTAVAISVQERRDCAIPVDSLSCELVASDGSSRVRGTVKGRCHTWNRSSGLIRNSYEITYQPQHRGRHQLHVAVEGCPIFNSPCTVNVLPNFTTPLKIVREGLRRPWNIAVREGGDMIVTERNGDSFSIIGASGGKKSVKAHNPSHAVDVSGPHGIAIDGSGNYLVCFKISGAYCIQKFSSTGEHLRTSGPLQFNSPQGITVHPLTHKVYVADTSNNKIQILNSDLSYCSCFGSDGSDKGEFHGPCNIAMAAIPRTNNLQGACIRLIASSLQSVDDASKLPLPRALRQRVVRAIPNLFVADRYNHRIQVFSADGQYVRQFGRQGKRVRRLNQPTGIAIDAHNIVYVNEYSSHRISIYTTGGELIKTVGGREYGLFGIAVDGNGAIYVCDTDNNCVKIFK